MSQGEEILDKELAAAETGHFFLSDIKSRKALQHSHHNVKNKAVRCHTGVLIVVIVHFFPGTKQEDAAASTLKVE